MKVSKYFYIFTAHKKQQRKCFCLTFSGVNLGIGVKIANTLNINDDQFVAGPLKGEVAERLRRLAAELFVDEAGIGVVLDVVAVDEVLDVKEGPVVALVELVDAHHEDVNLLRRVVPVKLLAPEFGIHLKVQLIHYIHTKII